MSDFVQVISLVLGSGVGIAGLGAAYRLGKREQRVEDREDRVTKLETRLGEHEKSDLLFQGHEQRISMLEKNTSIGSDHEKRLVDIEKVFSKQFPRVSADLVKRASRPDVHEAEFVDPDERRKRR